MIHSGAVVGAGLPQVDAHAHLQDTCPVSMTTAVLKHDSLSFRASLSRASDLTSPTSAATGTDFLPTWASAQTTSVVTSRRPCFSFQR